MIINIVDYSGERKQINVGDFELIDSIHVEVITGDEVVTVLYKDNTFEEYDSSEYRITDYYDGEYDVKAKDIKKWSNLSGDSYDRMIKMIEST